MPTATIAATLQSAIIHHQAGRLPQAEALYRDVLAQDTHCADALHLIGVIALQAGRNETAVDLIGRAVELSPTSADYYSNLGLAFRRLSRLEDAAASLRRALALRPEFPAALSNLGHVLVAQCQTDEASACFQQALHFDPNLADAHHNLGKLLSERGQIDQAKACFQRALALQPAAAETHFYLGVALRKQGQLDEAVAAYQRAVTINPNFPEAHYNLGVIAQKQGRFDDAFMLYRRAITLRPDFAAPHSNLASLYRESGQFENALACAQRALALKPDFVDAHNTIGAIYLLQERFDQALDCFRRALAFKPDYAEAHCNVGNVFKAQGRLDQAFDCFRQALALKPDYAEAHCNLGNVFKAQGRLDQALDCYRRAVALKPDDARAHSNLIYALHFHPGYDGRAIHEEHQRWFRQFAAPLEKPSQLHAIDRAHNRRLRLGYVSPDFRNHVECFFFLPLLEAHDHAQFELHAYASVANPDSITTRMRRSFDVWHDVRHLTDAQLAEQIRADGMDLIVDLTMHMADNRMLVFARRPAPVQVTWLGYPATAGLDTIDYRLTDHHLEPNGEDYPLSAEIPIRLPDSWCCYDPVFETPPCEEQPALRAGRITFGSLNNFCKINEMVLARWARVLITVQDSALLLLCPEGTTRERTLAILSSHGVKPSRVEFVSFQSRQSYLKTYNRIDICLDPFPYNGHTTTLDALWMGVPVLTLPGTLTPSRAGASLLTTIGLREMIAGSEDDYLALAVNFARDLPRLAALRASLRGCLQRSPLMDAKRFARATEAAYRTMWLQWCARQDAAKALMSPSA